MEGGIYFFTSSVLHGYRGRGRAEQSSSHHGGQRPERAHGCSTSEPQLIGWYHSHEAAPPTPSYVSLNKPEHPEECFRYFSIQYSSHDSLSQCINTTVRILQLGSVSPPARLFKIDSLGYFVSFTFPNTLRAHLAVTIPQAVILIGAALNL